MPNRKSIDNATKFTKWDEAIADAQERIKRLKFSIKVFRQNKKAGKPWQIYAVMGAHPRPGCANAARHPRLQGALPEHRSMDSRLAG